MTAWEAACAISIPAGEKRKKSKDASRGNGRDFTVEV